MTDKDRIERLEHILGTLIVWLHRELGEEAARVLLKELEDDWS